MENKIQSTGRIQIDYLTGIRGFAVLLILIAHSLPGHSFNKTIAYLGMSIFFILSGIVLTYVWVEHLIEKDNNFLSFCENYLTFIWARFARLGPLYLLVGIPYFASSAWSWDQVATLIPRFLFGVQSWQYDTFYDIYIKQLIVYAHSWSISSELFLYFLFPFLLSFLFRYKGALRWISILSIYGLYIILLIYFVKLNIYKSKSGFPPSQTWLDWFVYLSPYGRLIEFAIGILIGLELLRDKQINHKYSFFRFFQSSFSLIVIFFLCVYLSHREHINKLSSLLALLRMGPLFTLPICYLMINLVKKGDIIQKLFSNRILVSIGTWSYSIYLLQGYGIPFFGQYWKPGISEFIKNVTNVTVIMLLCYGSYELIEKPSRKFLLRFSPIKRISSYIRKKELIHID